MPRPGNSSVSLEHALGLANKLVASQTKLGSTVDAANNRRQNVSRKSRSSGGTSAWCHSQATGEAALINT